MVQNVRRILQAFSAAFFVPQTGLVAITLVLHCCRRRPLSSSSVPVPLTILPITITVIRNALLAKL